MQRKREKVKKKKAIHRKFWLNINFFVEVDNIHSCICIICSLICHHMLWHHLFYFFLLSFFAERCRYTAFFSTAHLFKRMESLSLCWKLKLKNDDSRFAIFFFIQVHSIWFVCQMLSKTNFSVSKQMFFSQIDFTSTICYEMWKSTKIFNSTHTHNDYWVYQNWKYMRFAIRIQWFQMKVVQREKHTFKWGENNFFVATTFYAYSFSFFYIVFRNVCRELLLVLLLLLLLIFTVYIVENESQNWRRMYDEMLMCLRINLNAK